jgi:hypothetical protein
VGLDHIFPQPPAMAAPSPALLGEWRDDVRAIIEYLQKLARETDVSFFALVRFQSIPDYSGRAGGDIDAHPMDPALVSAEILRIASHPPDYAAARPTAHLVATSPSAIRYKGGGLVDKLLTRFRSR